MLAMVVTGGVKPYRLTLLRGDHTKRAPAFAITAMSTGARPMP